MSRKSIALVSLGGNIARQNATSNETSSPIIERWVQGWVERLRLDASHNAGQNELNRVISDQRSSLSKDENDR